MCWMLLLSSRLLLDFVDPDFVFYWKNLEDIVWDCLKALHCCLWSAVVGMAGIDVAPQLWKPLRWLAGF